MFSVNPKRLGASETNCKCPELKTLEQAIFNLEIKKKSGSSINPDIHHSKVPSSGIVRNVKFALLQSPL